ncbi:MAG: carbohydrate kinase [Pseudomonadota bacterium]|nr:carbohydrate kinase [Pseudomonadota bacterium]
MTATNRNPICIFGEVLFDIFPDGKHVLGGAPFNVAWHLQAFGQTPHFISGVGDDEEGERIRTAMRGWGMDGSGLQTDPEHPTGRVTVSLDAGEPSYDIVPHCAYDYVGLDPDHHPSCGLLYHGSLALRNQVSARSLEQLKTNRPGSIFVDVNLRDPWWSRDQVMELVTDADWVKLNQDELRLLGGNGAELEEEARRFKDDNGLTGLILTLGAQGALGLVGDEAPVTVAPSSSLPVIDAVGAGDAFASVLILGVVNAWPLSDTMERAQAFASQIVQRRGATVDARIFYQPFIDAWDLHA